MPTKLNSAGQQQPYDSEGKFASMEGVSKEKIDSRPISKAFQKTPEGDFLLTRVFKGNEELANPKGKTIKSLKEKLDSLTVEVNGKTYSYKDKEVKEFLRDARQRAKKLDTSLIKTPERQAKREQWLNEVMEQQKNDRGGDVKKEWKATFVFGNAASGKSSVSDPLKNEMGAYEIDADLFKQKIPEFQEDVRNIRAVHEESSDLSKEMMRRAKKKVQISLSVKLVEMVIGTQYKRCIMN